MSGVLAGCLQLFPSAGHGGGEAGGIPLDPSVAPLVGERVLDGSIIALQLRSETL